MAIEIPSANDGGDSRAATRGRRSLTLALPAKKPGATERMFFTEQLTLLLETGESLHGALTTISRQSDNPKMAALIDAIALDVSEGQTFAYALSRHPEVFSSTYINLVFASESGGFMDKVLRQLLEMDKQRETLRNTLSSAATYPLFLIAFSIAVVIFVLAVVFPKFGTMFESIYNELPASTRVLMAMSDVLRERWWLVLGSLAFGIVAIRQWLRSEPGQRWFDHVKLSMPGVKDLFSQIYLVQSLQVLSLSLTNGVSIMDSLSACRDVVHNRSYRKLIENVEAKVQAGAGVAAGFVDASFVPSLAKQLIATGEQTGNLGPVMARISDYYDAQLNKKLNTLSKLAEPIMLLVMGSIVGVLVSSLILPIFKLSRAVS